MDPLALQVRRERREHKVLKVTPARPAPWGRKVLLERPDHRV